MVHIRMHDELTVCDKTMKRHFTDFTKSNYKHKKQLKIDTKSEINVKNMFLQTKELIPKLKV